MRAIPTDWAYLRARLGMAFPASHGEDPARRNRLAADIAAIEAQLRAGSIEFRLLADGAIEAAQGDHRKRYTRPTNGMRAAQAAIARRAPVPVSEFLAGNRNDPGTCLRNSIRAAARRLEADGFAALAGELTTERMPVRDGFVEYDPAVSSPRIAT